MSFGLGTFAADGADPFPGLVIQGQVTDLRPHFGELATVLALLQDWDRSLARLSALSATVEGLPRKLTESLQAFVIFPRSGGLRHAGVVTPQQPTMTEQAPSNESHLTRARPGLYRPDPRIPHVRLPGRNPCAAGRGR